MKTSVFCRWYDLWLGFYWDSKRRTLYWCILPTAGLKFEFSVACEKCGKQLFGRDISHYCGRPHCARCKVEQDEFDSGQW
jgi:hypothetical protein